MSEQQHPKTPWEHRFELFKKSNSFLTDIVSEEELPNPVTVSALAKITADLAKKDPEKEFWVPLHYCNTNPEGWSVLVQHTVWVSNKGKIHNLKNAATADIVEDKENKSMTMMANGDSLVIFSLRAYASTFIPIPEELSKKGVHNLDVWFKDGNRKNTTPDNLMWVEK